MPADAGGKRIVFFHIIEPTTYLFDCNSVSMYIFMRGPQTSASLRSRRRRPACRACCRHRPAGRPFTTIQFPIEPLHPPLDRQDYSKRKAGSPRMASLLHTQSSSRCLACPGAVPGASLSISASWPRFTALGQRRPRKRADKTCTAARALLGALQEGHGLRIAQESVQQAIAAAGARVPTGPLATGSGGAASPLPLPPASLFQLADLATALQAACFDAACQQQKDTLLIISLALPVLALAAAIAYLLRPPPQGSIDDGTLFEDGTTGEPFLFPSQIAACREACCSSNLLTLSRLPPLQAQSFRCPRARRRSGTGEASWPSRPLATPPGLWRRGRRGSGCA